MLHDRRDGVPGLLARPLDMLTYYCTFSKVADLRDQTAAAMRNVISQGLMLHDSGA